MSINDGTSGTEADSILGAMPSVRQKRGNYSVILERISGEIETSESFVIKFSILVRVPVTKIKHLMKNLPAVVWSGQSESKAKSLVSLIKEAGGVGRMVERHHSPGKEGPNPTENMHSSDLVCLRCGFPIKEGDEYCEFCMTPVGEKEHHNKTFHGHVKKQKKAIPPYRLFLYLVIFFVGIILSMVFR